MCIALLTTSHPTYPLILLSNRDEFLNRPTASASFWPTPNTNVLGGRDLLRSVQGTWLGLTTTGKIAVLTNYREDTTPSPTAISRGAIIRKFLTEDVGPMDSFVKDIVNTGIARDAGGFSLVCGHIGSKLAVISNRASDQGEVPWIMGDVVQTIGLSNASFHDRSWPKVTLGEEMTLNAVRASIKEADDERALIERLLTVLSHDTLPRQGDLASGGLETYMTELRKSIFVPPLGRKSMAGQSQDEGTMRAAKTQEKVQVFDSAVTNGTLDSQKLGIDGIYGTQKQTVVLVDKQNRVRFFERTLYDENSKRVETGRGDVDVEFVIDRSRSEE